MLALLKAKVTIVCNDYEEVEAPLVSMYLSSSYVKEMVDRLDDATDLRIEAVGIGKKAVERVVDYMATSSRCLAKVASNIREDDSDEDDGDEADLRLVTKRDVPILEPDTIGQVVRFADMFMLKDLMDEFIEIVRLRPTLRLIVAMDHCHETNANWASDAVVKYLAGQYRNYRDRFSQSFAKEAADDDSPPPWHSIDDMTQLRCLSRELLLRVLIHTMK